MTGPRYSQLILVTVLVAAALLCQCSTRTTPTTPTTVDEVVTLTITPTSGVPGTVLRVGGVTGLTPETDSLSATIGGNAAPVIAGDSGQVLVSIPLVLNDSGQVTVPAHALDLVLLSNGKELGHAKNAITVQALPPPTRTLEDVSSSLETISATLDTIMSTFSTGPGVEEQYVRAIIAGLDSLVKASDSSSVASATEGISADSSLAYVTAVLDAAGVIEGLMNMAEQLQAISNSAKASTPTSGRVSLGRSASPAAIPTLIIDQDLARRMQFYVIAKMFGETVINQTGQTFAETVGLTAGAIGIAANVPYVGIVSAVLTLIDVVVNKIVVGALPATIDSMSVTFAGDTINLGDTTAATVYILASNLPPSLSVQDLVGLTLTALGLMGGSPEIASFKDVLLNTVNFFVGTMQAVVASYSAQHPELNLDVNVAALMPPMKWEAYIDDPHLVTCQSVTPSIVTGMTTSPNWQADPVNYGEGRVYVMPATGPGALLLTLPPGFTYSGGAFGMDMIASRTRSIWVARELALQVDFANTITVDGANVLGVDAGYYDGNGTPQWEPGIDISLTVTDGTADVTSGITDAQGHFSSIITIDSTADSVTVHVVATGTDGSQGDTTVVAQTERNSIIAFVADIDGAPAIWTISPDGSGLRKSVSIDDATSGDFPWAFSVSPDGNNFAFNGYFYDATAYPFYYSDQLWIASSSGLLRRVGRDLKYIIISRSNPWSPADSNRIVFPGWKKVTNPDPSVLFTEDISTNLRDSIGPLLGGSLVDAYEPTFSPDGELIAFRSGGEGSVNLSLCNKDGSNVHILTQDNDINTLTWSQDGSYILSPMTAYWNSVKAFPVNGGPGIHLLSSANGAALAMTPFNTVNAFAYLDGVTTPNVNDLKFYSFEDNAVHNVLNGVNSRDIAISPDDRYAVYSSASLDGNLFKVNLETGEISQLTTQIMEVRHIIWYSKQP